MEFQQRVLNIIRTLYGRMSLKAFVDILRQSRTTTSMMSISSVLQVPMEEQEHQEAYIVAFSATTACLSDNAHHEFTQEMLAAPMVDEELFHKIERLVAEPAAEVRSRWEREGCRSGALHAAVVIQESIPA